MGESEAEMDSFLLRFHLATLHIDRYYTPVLCLLGFIGNSLSLLVFCLDSQYRSQSASYYLSALALSDTGYLLNLFLVWLESVRELVITSDITCPLVMYFGQVTCFLSIYIIVAFSVERYRAVHYPLTRAKICTRSKARKIIALLTATALLLFSYAWVIAKVVALEYQVPAEQAEIHQLTEPVKNRSSFHLITTSQPEYAYRCSVPEEYYQVSEIANYLDTFITLIVPFLLITFFNVRISWSLWKFKEVRNEIIATTSLHRNKSSSLPTSSLSSENGVAITKNQKRGGCFEGFFGKGNNSIGKTTQVEETELVEVISKSAQLKPADSLKNNESGEKGMLSIDENSAQICSVSQSQQPSGQSHISAVSISRLPQVTASSEVRVAKTLLLVSSVFLLLNLPLHVIRCTQFIQSLASSSSQDEQRSGDLEGEISSTTDLKDVFLPTAQLWANMLFNTNFAVNFLLYCASGRTFRKSLRNVVAHCILRRNQTSRLQTTSSTYCGGAPANLNNRHTCARRASYSNEE